MTGDSSSIDCTRPSIARVYDYLLGGKDNYAVDRDIGDVFKRDLPGSVAIAFANRAALTRAVGEIVTTTEVRQFIDLGSGLPTADNVHQVAQRRARDTRVVYVDTDPQVLVHGRALLGENDRTRVVPVDVRDPEAVRSHPDTQELIDFDRPVAVMFSAILHHVNDEEDPAGIVRYWRDHVPSGSCFFVSHFRSGNNPETAEAEKVLQGTFGRGRWRTDEEIAALLDGLDILEPGIVPASVWRSEAAGRARDDDGEDGEDGEDELTVWERLIAAGMARKP
ncbi:SAM-dependent methyltransferase [Streptomyces sp. AC512_CC834]|uniref:SAM-dependent methyltransferase n=1 Tax=Streptomyces sp. AC512_CC834 TaxID=2823691 RepID=UPI001C256C22|nr:SAM-dependent methyltransferase [Streptomyces sp. AC512_CC834]